MLPTTHITQAFASRSLARSLEIWREAASLVTTRWRAFLDAEPDNRDWAFAAYVAALDAEEAAAAEMNALSSRLAA